MFYMPDFTRIDLYVPERSPFNESRMLRRIRMTIAGTSVPVSSPEDTILKKLEWYRKGNEVSHRQWEDVTAMIRVQGPRLDLEYLRKWAPALAVTDLLERALSQGA